MAEKEQKKSYRCFWFYTGIFFLAVFLAGRMLYVYEENRDVDFILFFSDAYAAMRGWDFFDVNNLIFYEWDEPMMVLPGLILFYVPYTLLDIHTARVLYYVLSLGASVFVYVWLFRLTGLLGKVDFRKPNLNALMFFLGGFIFLNSSPQVMCQRNGQVGIWVLLLLLLFFTVSPEKRLVRTILFGLAAVFKYSMITFFAPLLFIKKQYFICIAAFLVFLLVCVWPALAGYNVVDLYIRYAEVICNTLDGGYNSFKLAGHDLLQFDFFRISFLNLLGKLFFGVTMLFIFWKERKKGGIGLNLLAVVFCFTMLVSYHRLYDNIIIVLLLLVKTNFLVLKKNWRNASFCGGFLTFYLLPVSWVFTFAGWLGEMLPGLGALFYLPVYAQYGPVVPVIAWSQVLLGLFVLYLYLKTEEDYIFKLGKND